MGWTRKHGWKGGALERWRIGVLLVPWTLKNIQSSPHRTSGLCPSGARMLSMRAGYPLEGALASPAPNRVLLLSDSRPTPTVVCVLVLPGPLAPLQLWGHPCPTVFSTAC